MWQCECGEFNNEQSTFCVKCNKVRVVKDRARVRQRAPMNTDTMFRRIQDFILLDIAVTAMVVVYCFWRATERVPIDQAEDGLLYVRRGVAFEAIIPLLLVVILQLGLLVHVLRVLYQAAVSSERNSIFLQKIYESSGGLEEEEQEESAAQSVIKPPTGSGASKERRPPPRDRDRNSRR